MKKYLLLTIIPLLALTACTSKPKSAVYSPSGSPTPTKAPPIGGTSAQPSASPLKTTQPQTKEMQEKAQKAMSAYLDQFKSPKKVQGKQLLDYKINQTTNIEMVGKELRFYVNYSIKVADTAADAAIIGTDNGTPDPTTGWINGKNGEASFMLKDDGTYQFLGIVTGSGGS
jgi:hypothetical protein